MSLKSKRICKCCGKEYEYCPHCGSKSDELWRNLTDTKECREVFNIVAAYNVGRATADQVKKVLKANNVTDYSTFNPAIVKALDEITNPVVVEPVVEPVKAEPVVEEPMPEPIEDKVPVVEPQIVESPVIEMPEIPAVVNEVQDMPRKNRKKKYRRRNADVEL